MEQSIEASLQTFSLTLLNQFNTIMSMITLIACTYVGIIMYVIVVTCALRICLICIPMQGPRAIGLAIHIRQITNAHVQLRTYIM